MGGYWKKCRAVTFSSFIHKMQRLCKINNLEALRTIKLNAHILHFWRYSPVLGTVPQFFHTFRGMRGGLTIE